jgi:hypothetical protein
MSQKLVPFVCLECLLEIFDVKPSASQNPDITVGTNRTNAVRPYDRDDWIRSNPLTLIDQESGDRI